ncbi:hypothetical protein Z043_106865 [Scleropages formosus]|uniref:Uncharacterized protein n=1 Tax=Scleropages formosus TaxID=113540 RepID=A0A0P7UVI5_SCLFO|nr:hypothetical protein Z043_106865 [Scleropages formosus]
MQVSRNFFLPSVAGQRRVRHSGNLEESEGRPCGENHDLARPPQDHDCCHAPDEPPRAESWIPPRHRPPALHGTVAAQSRSELTPVEQCFIDVSHIGRSPPLELPRPPDHLGLF